MLCSVLDKLNYRVTDGEFDGVFTVACRDTSEGRGELKHLVAIIGVLAEPHLKLVVFDLAKAEVFWLFLVRSRVTKRKFLRQVWLLDLGLLRVN